MALFTIIRVYEVPAGDRIAATERMLDALSLHVERDFHVADYIRSPEDKPGNNTSIHHDTNPHTHLTSLPPEGVPPSSSAATLA